MSDTGASSNQASQQAARLSLENHNASSGSNIGHSEDGRAMPLPVGDVNANFTLGGMDSSGPLASMKQGTLSANPMDTFEGLAPVQNIGKAVPQEVQPHFGHGDSFKAPTAAGDTQMKPTGLFGGASHG
ncbi:MAG: hypothetical protein V4694_00185 [Pseudomonadota bacterium]